MSNNNYCEYYDGRMCVDPDGKTMICSVDFESIYDIYAKQNIARMCSRKQKWDSSKNIETKAQ